MTAVTQFDRGHLVSWKTWFQEQSTTFDGYNKDGHHGGPTPSFSLGTRPSEKLKRGSGDRLGWKFYCVPGMQACFWLIACLHVFIGNAHRKLLV